MIESAGGNGGDWRLGKSFSLFVDQIDVYCSTAYCFLTKLV
jgi:hypothetical protein